MCRYLHLLVLVALCILAGCGGGGDKDDAAPADAVTADGTSDGASDGSSTDGQASDGSAADGIVTPTVDDTAERAKVRDMDVATLVESLGDAELSDAASDELASRGGDAVKPLIDALDSDDVGVQQKAIFTLGQIGSPAKDALPKLKAIAADSNSEVVQDSAKFAIDAIEGR